MKLADFKASVFFLSRSINLESNIDMQAKEIFEVLVREHCDMLTLFIRTMVRNEDAVDEVFQETMLVAWRKMDEFDRTRPFGPWLRGIATRVAKVYWRKTYRMKVNHELVIDRVVEQFEHLDAQKGDTLDEKLELLHRCMDDLPEKYSHPVTQRYTLDMKGEVLAKRLNLSKEALKKRIQRGRAMLLECMQRKMLLIEGLGSKGQIND